MIYDVITKDLTNIHDLHSLPETDRYNTLGIPDNIEQTQKLLNDWITSNTAYLREKYIFSIFQKETGTFVGLAGITLGKPGYRKAEIWYKLHVSFWNKGYATELVREFLRFGFEDLRLHRMEAGCAVDNAASVKVLEKCGFIREGRTRKLLPIRGEWSDNFGYAILNEDFEKMAK